MGTSESQTETNTKLTRIAWLSSKDKTRQFDNLMHHFNEISLEDCWSRWYYNYFNAIILVKGFIVSLVREIRTLGSNEGEVRVIGFSTL